MGFILETNALLRLISNDPTDPFIQGIDWHRVRPFIDATALAQAYVAVRLQLDVSPTIRRTLEDRLRYIELRMSSGHARAPVFFAPFDLGAAGILADLIGLDWSTAPWPVNAIDLVPAAIAMRRGFVLLADPPEGPFQWLASAIPPPVGVLVVRSADDPLI